MSTTSIKIIQAASEIVGGDEALAERLGIGHHALAMFMEGRRHLPDALLLRVASYYHDIGKTIRPYFFTDNQSDRENEDGAANCDRVRFKSLPDSCFHSTTRFNL